MRTFFITLFLLISYVVNAQYVEAAKAVLSFAKKSKEEMMTEELMKINKKLETSNKESVLNKLSNLKQEDYLSKAEDFLTKVDAYIKKGREIKEIYEKEESILLKVKEMDRIYRVSFSGGNRGDLKETTEKIFKKTGELVDLASGVITDNNYRLSSEERRNYLKEILADLTRIEVIIDNRIYTAKEYIAFKQSQREQEKMKRDFENELKRKQEIFNRM